MEERAAIITNVLWWRARSLNKKYKIWSFHAAMHILLGYKSAVNADIGMPRFLRAEFRY